MAAAGLGGAAMAAPVMGYDAIAVLEEEQHLRIPIIGRQRPAVAEHDGLTFAPVLVEDLNAVFGGDRVQVEPPFTVVHAGQIGRPNDSGQSGTASPDPVLVTRPPMKRRRRVAAAVSTARGERRAQGSRPEFHRGLPPRPRNPLVPPSSPIPERSGIKCVQ